MPTPEEILAGIRGGSDNVDPDEALKRIRRGSRPTTSGEELDSMLMSPVKTGADLLQGFGQYFIGLLPKAAEKMAGRELPEDQLRQVFPESATHAPPEDPLAKFFREYSTPANPMQEMGQKGAHVATYAAGASALKGPQWVESTAPMMSKLATLVRNTAAAGATGGAVDASIASVVGDDPKEAAFWGSVLPAAGALTAPVRQAAFKMAAEMFNGVLQPSSRAGQITHGTNEAGYKSTFYGRNPAKTIINEKISGRTLESVYNQIEQRLKTQSATLDNVLKSADTSGIEIDVIPVLQRAKDVIARNPDEITGDSLAPMMASLNTILDTAAQRNGGLVVKNGTLSTSLSPSQVVALKRQIDETISESVFKKAANAELSEDTAQKMRFLYEIRSGLDRLIDDAVPQSKALNHRISDLYVARDVAKIADLRKQSGSQIHKRDFWERFFNNTATASHAGKLSRWLDSLDGFISGGALVGLTQPEQSAYDRISER